MLIDGFELGVATPLLIVRYNYSEKRIHLNKSDMWICIKKIIFYTWKYQMYKLITITFNRNRKFTLELSEIGNTPITFFFGGDLQKC